MNNFKKTVIAALITAILFGATACSADKNYSMSINSTDISDAVFAYNFAKVTGRPTDYNLNSDSSQEEFKQAATELCCEYIARNTLAAELNVELDTAEKSDCAKNVSNLWRIYGSYYKQLGITKQQFQKIKTAEAINDDLIVAYYNQSGIEPVKASAIKKYFFSNYVAFKTINGYFNFTDSSGASHRLSNAAIQTIINKFDIMRSRINNGNESFSSVSGSYSSSNTSTQDENDTSSQDGIDVITESTYDYPEGFFEKVQKLDYSKAEVLQFNDNIFLVERIDMADNDEKYFNAYKNDCLISMKSGEMKNRLSSIAEDYSVEYNDSEIKYIIKKFDI